jgi:hypothetical protein
MSTLTTTVTGSVKFKAEDGITIEPILGSEDYEPNYLISVVAPSEQDATIALHETARALYSGVGLVYSGEAAVVVTLVAHLREMIVRDAYTGSEWAEVVGNLLDEAGL